MRPIALPKLSVNQRSPSGPAAIPNGRPRSSERGNSVIRPAGVIRPIALPRCSVNQRLRSGPTAIPTGSASSVGIVNSVTLPPVVMRPILALQIPSGPRPP